MPTLIGRRRTRFIKTDLVFSFVLTASKGQLILVSKTATFVDRLTAAKGQITLAGKAITTVPVSVVAPVVSGTASVGSTLSCTTGTWSNSPTSYTYQWYRAVTSGGVPITDGNGNYVGVAISGATASTYALVTGDLGEFIFCDVLATNAAGPSLLVKSSNYVGPVDPAASAVTWNPADTGSGITFANGNLDALKSSSPWSMVRATLGKSSGKRYFEITAQAGVSHHRPGLATASADLEQYLGITSSGFSYSSSAGTFQGTGSGFSAFVEGVPLEVGDVWGFAVDLDAGKVWVAKNNDYTAFRSGSDPATATNHAVAFTAPLTLFPAASFYGSESLNARIAASGTFTYSPPSGFIAWNA